MDNKTKCDDLYRQIIALQFVGASSWDRFRELLHEVKHIAASEGFTLCNDDLDNLYKWSNNGQYKNSKSNFDRLKEILSGSTFHVWQHLK